MDPGPGACRPAGTERFPALWQKSQALMLLSAETNARAQAVREQIHRGRSRREILRDSAFARLQAKMSTMPTIEQAKGIVMARRRCGPEEAFDLLRQMSQRTNIKLHLLAARMVDQVASSGDGGAVTPISLGARRGLRSRTQTRRSPG